jgi:hypothetical protein
MSKRKLEIVQARQSRGEELRLGFILAALEAVHPLKLAQGSRNKGGTKRSANAARIEPAAA